jgi:hypothetical protein
VEPYVPPRYTILHLLKAARSQLGVSVMSSRTHDVCRLESSVAVKRILVAPAGSEKLLNAKPVL